MSQNASRHDPKAYMKMWRLRREAQDPGYHERERAAARERSRAIWEAKKNDPEYIAQKRERQRLVQQRRRQNPEKLAHIKQINAKSMAKPENKAKQAVRQKAWKQANAEHVKAYSSQWKQKNTEHVVAYQAAYSKEYRQLPEVQFETWKRALWKNYKLTPEGFDALWSKQSGQCAICFVEMKFRGRSNDSVAVDHNHKTKAVRALLCRRCNHGIGSLQDDAAVIESAVRYLKTYGQYGGKNIEGK